MNDVYERGRKDGFEEFRNAMMAVKFDGRMIKDEEYISGLDVAMMVVNLQMEDCDDRRK